MGFIFIGFIALFVMLITASCWRNSYGDINVGCTITAIITFLILVFCIVGLCNLYTPENTSIQIDGLEHIVALQDKTGTEGKFYARRGYMTEELYYFYMIDLGDCSKAGKIPANRTYVYEVKSDFRVEWTRVHYDWWIFHEVAQDYVWKLYVPKGTIVEDYMIDLG